MKGREFDKYVNANIYCGRVYEPNKDYVMGKLAKGNVSFK
jgi:hypothetical protein